VRVERQAEDELQMLIDVFNRMALAIRAQQEDLRARRDYIEKILLNATTGVVSFDTAGRVVTVNPSARLLTGAPLEPGAALAAALDRSGLGPLAALLPASPASFSERREEVELRTGAEERRMRAVLVPLRDQGEPAGGLLLLEDITESVRSNRLRAWAEMAQRIAHEVKNPLTPILLSAEHLRHVYRERPREFAAVLDDCLRTITEQVRALRQMAREFGTYARIPEPQLERADVRGVVEEALAPYATSAPPELRFERRWDDHPLWARLDRTLLRRALVNLIENSLDALGGSGTIRVGIDALVERGRPWVRILIDDDGPGIDPAVAPRLFEPFFSTKGSGTGLGLAIVRQAVEAHGGIVRVGQPPGGRGTRMILLLPEAPG
jgi:two-component system nitrogen regulation sensor histidine kinase NtrY